MPANYSKQSTDKLLKKLHASVEMFRNPTALLGSSAVERKQQAALLAIHNIIEELEARDIFSPEEAVFNPHLATARASVLSQQDGIDASHAAAYISAAEIYARNTRPDCSADELRLRTQSKLYSSLASYEQIFADLKRLEQLASWSDMSKYTDKISFFESMQKLPTSPSSSTNLHYEAIQETLGALKYLKGQDGEENELYQRLSIDLKFYLRRFINEMNRELIAIVGLSDPDEYTRRYQAWMNRFAGGDCNLDTMKANIAGLYAHDQYSASILDTGLLSDCYKQYQSMASRTQQVKVSTVSLYAELKGLVGKVSDSNQNYMHMIKNFQTILATGCLYDPNTKEYSIEAGDEVKEEVRAELVEYQIAFAQSYKQLWDRFATGPYDSCSIAELCEKAGVEFDSEMAQKIEEVDQLYPECLSAIIKNMVEGLDSISDSIYRSSKADEFQERYLDLLDLLSPNPADLHNLSLRDCVPESMGIPSDVLTKLDDLHRGLLSRDTSKQFTSSIAKLTAFSDEQGNDYDFHQQYTDLLDNYSHLFPGVKTLSELAEKLNAKYPQSPFEIDAELGAIEQRYSDYLITAQSQLQEELQALLSVQKEPSNPGIFVQACSDALGRLVNVRHEAISFKGELLPLVNSLPDGESKVELIHSLYALDKTYQQQLFLKELSAFSRLSVDEKNPRPYIARCNALMAKFSIDVADESSLQKSIENYISHLPEELHEVALPLAEAISEKYTRQCDLRDSIAAEKAKKTKKSPRDEEGFGKTGSAHVESLSFISEQDLAKGRLSTYDLKHDFQDYLDDYLYTFLQNVSMERDGDQYADYIANIKQAKLQLLQTFIDSELEWETMPDEFKEFEASNKSIVKLAEKLVGTADDPESGSAAHVSSAVRKQVLHQCNQIEASQWLCNYSNRDSRSRKYELEPGANLGPAPELRHRLDWLFHINRYFLNVVKSDYSSDYPSELGGALLGHYKELADDLIAHYRSLPGGHQDKATISAQLVRLQKYCRDISALVSECYTDIENEWSIFMPGGEYAKKITEPDLSATEELTAAGVLHSLPSTTQAPYPPQPFRPSVEPPLSSLHTTGSMPEFQEMVTSVLAERDADVPLASQAHLHCRNIVGLESKTDDSCTLQVRSTSGTEPAVEDVLVRQRGKALEFSSAGNGYDAIVSAAIAGAVLLAKSTPDEPPIITLCDSRSVGYDDMCEALSSQLTLEFVGCLIANPPRYSTFEIEGSDPAEVNRVKGLVSEQINEELFQILTNDDHPAAHLRGRLEETLCALDSDLAGPIASIKAKSSIDDAFGEMEVILESLRCANVDKHLPSEVDLLRLETPSGTHKFEP